jgi:hypothetical protein
MWGVCVCVCVCTRTHAIPTSWFPNYVIKGLEAFYFPWDAANISVYLCHTVKTKVITMLVMRSELNNSLFLDW